MADNAKNTAKNTPATQAGSDSANKGTGHGHTSIDDSVVSKIAGIATREVSGVYDLGGGMDRFAGSVREFVSGGSANVSQGIAVEVGERQAAVDVTIIAEYGVAIRELAEAIRQNVISSVERMTGLEVTEVNVDVSDVHTDYQTPQEREEEAAKQREEQRKAIAAANEPKEQPRVQ